MTQAILVEGVSYAFGAGRTSRPVLKDVSFSADAGDIIVLTGRSGSGKTSLLTLLGGLRRLQSGRITSLGKDLSTLGDSELDVYRLAVRFIFQQNNLLSSLTVSENVIMGLGGRAGRNPKVFKRSQAMLCAVGLEDRAKSYRHELSGGEQQRVAVARALISGPRLLLADEPTASLDSATGQSIVSLIRELAKSADCTVIIATHDERLLKFGSKRIHLEDGVLSEV